MNFDRLSEAYFSGTSESKMKSSIEYKSMSGAGIGSGLTTQQTTLTVKGNGELEFFRRGDFMERGEVWPGIWRAFCQNHDIENVWDKLGNLGPDSFPERMADPGDTVTNLTAFFPNTIEKLEWGPRDHSAPAPGSDFLVALAPLINQASQGECLWAVEMQFVTLETSSQGFAITLVLKNPGKLTIGIVLSNPNNQDGFLFQYALDREAPEGMTALPPDWTSTMLDIPNRDSEILWPLDPDKSITVKLYSDLKLAPNQKLIGKLRLQQTRYIDTLAGIPILTGMCFSELFEFKS